MDKIYLDQDGYENYLKEIDRIREKIRKNSSDISEFASDDAYGDGWHDNFAYEQAIQKENALMYELNEKLKGLSPLEKLNQGYAYVSDEAGRTVTDATKVAVGDTLSVYVKNGLIEALVTGKELLGNNK